MNQFFNFNRFTILVLKHWADHKKRYFLSLSAYLGLVTLWYLCGILVSGFERLPSDVQFATFFVSLFALGTFYASLYYSDLASRAKGGHFLLVPASSFEKFLCSLLFTVILFSLFLAAAFYVADVLMVNVANSVSAANPDVRKSEVVNVFTLELIRFNPNVAINFFGFFFSVQSLFLFGSVYFNKYNFIKTIITCFLIFFLCFLLLYLFHVLFPNIEDDIVISNGKLLPQVLRFLSYAIAPIFWAFTYFQLRAKQV